MGTPEYPAEVEQNNLKSTANVMAMGTKGFTAAVWPQGDVDVFEFDVTDAGTSATIKTSDGMGGCPAGAKTYVRVYDAASSVLASNNGSAGCANLTPSANPNLAGLPIGKYYVKVESANINAIPYYVLDIKLSAPGCGDGIVQVLGGEQCDDNNNNAGDGCSATCQLESGNYLNEVEPNGTQDTGNLLDGYDGAIAQINPLGDNDWYTFNVTVPGSSVTAEVGDGLNGCPAGFDSKIYLYDPAKNLLISDDDGGASPCSKISPAQYTQATNLPVGLYAVKVERYGNSSTVPFYVFKLKVSAPGCGDGIFQTGEQCDDNNTVNGDGCSSTCQFEKNYASEVETNDTQALATPLPAAADGFIGSINPAGDLDYYSFDVTTAGSSVTISTSNGLGACPAGFDSKIYLYDPTHTQIAVNDDGLYPPCSTISPASTMAASNLAPGTYYVRVERYGNNATQAQYVVSIKVNPPGCGDGIQQAGEQCDDNNTIAGDGCSPTCMAEAPFEIEPNGSTATATPLWPSTTTWKGAITPVGDHDYYSFTLSTVGSVTLLTHDVGSPTTCGFDTKIHLLDANGTQLVEDDDTGPGSCSKIDPVANTQAHNMPAGTYYVWVQRYGDSQTIPAYQLDITIQ
ncbi:MAG: DVUA0089 family protein [Minicystis sp.]